MAASRESAAIFDRQSHRRSYETPPQSLKEANTPLRDELYRLAFDPNAFPEWIQLAFPGSRRVVSRPVSEVTRILQSIEGGDANAADQLLPLVYEELRKLAAHKMAGEAAGQTLQPTALVHEAWLKLAGSSHQQWSGRGHFFGAAAEAMRRILIDRARKRRRGRHGHGLERINLDEVDLAITTDDEILLRVTEALDRLAAEAPGKAAVVKLRYFAGLTIPDAAEALGISLATAKRHWTYARAWLFAELNQTR